MATAASHSSFSSSSSPPFGLVYPLLGVCLKLTSFLLASTSIAKQYVFISSRIRHSRKITIKPQSPNIMTEETDTQTPPRASVDPASALFGFVLCAQSGKALQRKYTIPTVDGIQEQRAKMQAAKRKHRLNPSCETEKGRTCGACHFYSGAIAALSELLGEPGVID